METIKIILNNGEVREVIKGKKLKEIIELLYESESPDVIVAKFNGKIIYDDFVFNKSGKLFLYDINSSIGNRAYERGLIYLFELCASKILGDDTQIIVKHSLDKGVFCRINKEISQEDISNIKKLMKQIVNVLYILEKGINIFV